MNKSLNEWLEIVQVNDIPDTEESNQPAIKYLEGWYAVSTYEDGGIIAYFNTEVAAFRFRLDYINSKLNPV